MKWYKKYSSIHHYLAALKRQPVHMQHVYAFLFAGGITTLLAASILYFDYGYWRERYVRSETASSVEELKSSESLAIATLDTNIEKTGFSPFEMFGSFASETKEQWKKIRTGEAVFFTTKEVYHREDR